MRRLALGLLILASPAGAEDGWTPRASVEFGVDSFAQIYRLTDFASESLLTDEATLRTESDVFTEFRGAAEFGLRQRRGANETDLRTRFSYGTDTMRGEAEARWRGRNARHRWDADLVIEGRRFREDTDLTLSSDFGELRTRAHYELAASDRLDLGVRTRAFLTRYERPSAFELDNERVDVSLTASLQGDLGQWFDVEFGAGRRWADSFDDPDDPDVTPSVLAYDRVFGLLEWAHDTGDRWRIGLSQWFERRDYDDPDLRSGLWTLVVEPEITLRLDDAWSLRGRTTTEWLDFDTSSETYYDLALGRVGLALQRRWRSFEWSAEPRLGWLSAPTPREDEYVQPSLVLGFDGFGGERFFVSIREEIGHRDYREATASDALDLYSDYWFLRSTILASVTLVRGTSLEFFLSDEPESHRNEVDDSRLTLVTTTLRVRF